MAVDVETTIEIARPRAEVAAFAADPDNVHAWYKNITRGERLVMRTADGPFPMETTYVWVDGPGDTTIMALRNRGQPAGFSSIAAPMMAAGIRRNNRADLRRLK